MTDTTYPLYLDLAAGLTQVLNAEGRAHNIRACLLYPGAMDTNWGMWDPSDRAANRGGLPGFTYTLMNSIVLFSMMLPG